MFTDIVFPNNNEAAFEKIAKRLGIRLLFAYPYAKSVDKKHAVITDEKTTQKAQAYKLRIAGSGEKNRYLFEKAKPDIIYNLEFSPRKDFIHHRNSGLNQVLCRLAQKNNIIIGFNFGRLLKAKNPATAMGRIRQNVQFCRKYHVSTAIATFATSPLQLRSPHDLQSLAELLGMHPSEAKNSLMTIYKSTS